MGAAESPWAAVTGWPVARGQPPRWRSATNMMGPGGLLGWGLGAGFWGVWNGHLFLGRVTSGSQNRGRVSGVRKGQCWRGQGEEGRRMGTLESRSSFGGKA